MKITMHKIQVATATILIAFYRMGMFIFNQKTTQKSLNKNIKIGLLILTWLFSAGISSSQDLVTDTVKIEEVVVTASRVQVARKNVPLTVSTVSQNEIKISNESAILPILSHRIPGMFVTERGVTGFGVASGSAGQISMRGVGGTAPNTQVLVLIDGHPQFQGVFGHPLPDAYVSSDVEKVEVIRGPASILYGSNAMAGAINIITKQQTRQGFSGNAKLSYGSYNTQKYMASGGFKEGPFSIFASVNHNRTDGHRDTSEFKIINGFIKAGYQLNNNFNITADMNIADFEAQDPGPVFNPAFFGIDIMRGKASLAVKNYFEKVEGGVIAFYNFGDHDLSDGWVSQDYHTGISLYQGLQLFRGNRITIGTDYKKVAGIGNNGVGADEWHSASDLSAYMYAQQTLYEKLILSAGYRIEKNSIFGTENVPQAGFSYHLNNKTTVKGSFSKGFRNPTLMELYLFAPNTELKPEHVLNYELGVSRERPDKKLRTELTVFLLEGENIIEVLPNDSPPPPVKRQNAGSFTNKGIEIEVSWLAGKNLQFNSNYSYLDLDRPRLAAPEHQFFLEGVYSNRNFRASASVQEISDLYTYIGDPEPISENYSLVNLMLSYQLTKNIELFLSGKNLLDSNYSINFGYPMPGITVFSGVNLTL